MFLLEIKELVDGLKEEFGIDLLVVVVVVGFVVVVEVEEKIEFNVVLKLFGDKKIEVIKVICEVIGLGLVEVKKLVEIVDVVIKENVKKDEVEVFKVKFEVVGVVVEIV